MRRIALSFTISLLSCASLFAAEVQVKPSAAPKGSQSPQPQQSAPMTALPKYSGATQATPGSELLQEELLRRLDDAKFVPAIYNHEPVAVIFYGTMTFSVVNGKPRLRIFANQEKGELAKEGDFVGPQPFVGRESKFDGLHYPTETPTAGLSGLVELGVKVDADGNMKELRVVSETPPLLGFARAAAEDFRVARFIPAFRDGKPVECGVTLPIYYEFPG